MSAATGEKLIAIPQSEAAVTQFSWAPKPPVVTESHPTQRYFCAPGNEPGLRGVGGQVEGFPRGEVEFYRNVERKEVRLSVRVLDGAAYAGVHLSASELRAVARLCLDAAHDLETVPALEDGK